MKGLLIDRATAILLHVPLYFSGNRERYHPSKKPSNEARGGIEAEPSYPIDTPANPTVPPATFVGQSFVAWSRRERPISTVQ